MFLKEAGYTTIHIGKAHWGAKGTPGEDPLNLGFDVNIAGHTSGRPSFKATGKPCVWPDETIQIQKN